MAGRRRIRAASRAIDVGRLGEALARPGMDTRVWSSLAIVTKVVVDSKHGPFVDVVLLPSEEPMTARVGASYAGSGFGQWSPLAVNDEVKVVAPSGDPAEGLVVTQRLWSAADPPPAEAVDHPDDWLLRTKAGQTVRVMTSGGGRAVLGSEHVDLGQENAPHPVLKGDTYRGAEDSMFTKLDGLLSALNGFCTAAGAVPPLDINPGVIAALGALVTALGLYTTQRAAFNAQAATYLSDTTKTV